MLLLQFCHLITLSKIYFYFYVSQRTLCCFITSLSIRCSFENIICIACAWTEAVIYTYGLFRYRICAKTSVFPMFEQVDFCYLNSKSSRKKLVRTLFNVPRTSLELIPYYSRMIATLSTCMKDVTPMILQLLEEEFNFLMNKKVIFPLCLSISFL